MGGPRGQHALLGVFAQRVLHREGLGSASNWGPHKEAAEYTTALNAALILEQQVSGVRVPTLSRVPRMRASSGGFLDSPEFDKRTVKRRIRQSHTEIELGHISLLESRHLPPRSSDDLEVEALRSQLSDHEPLFDTTHVKNYRPQCLVLSGPPHRRPALALLAAGLRKAHGVTVFGDVLVGDFSDRDVLRTRNERASLSYVQKYGLRAFNDIIIAPSFRAGCRSLMQVSGLGRRMRVNTIVMGFLDDWSENIDRPRKYSMEGDLYSPKPSVVDYVGVI